MHNRSGVVIIENEQVALIKRQKNGKTYYTFPGGKVEAFETLEEAAIREAYEELGVDVIIGERLLALPYNGMQYYFRATITGGQFGTGTGEEWRAPKEEGSYEAVWLPIDEVQSTSFQLIPEEMKARL